MESKPKKLGRPRNPAPGDATLELFDGVNPSMVTGYGDLDEDSTGAGDNGAGPVGGGSESKERALLKGLWKLARKADSESVRLQAFVKYEALSARIEARQATGDGIPGELAAFLVVLRGAETAAACSKTL